MVVIQSKKTPAKLIMWFGAPGAEGQKNCNKFGVSWAAQELQVSWASCIGRPWIKRKGRGKCAINRHVYCKGRGKLSFQMTRSYNPLQKPSNLTNNFAKGADKVSPQAN